MGRAMETVGDTHLEQEVPWEHKSQISLLLARVARIMGIFIYDPKHDGMVIA